MIMASVVDSQPQSCTKRYVTHEGGVEWEEEDPGIIQMDAATLRNFSPGVRLWRMLETSHKLEVVQRLDVLEVCLGFTRNNRYCIYNQEGEQVFYVYEASVCFHRQLTGALRGLELRVSFSDEDQDVLLLRRPGACSSRCCWACCNLQRMEILDTIHLPSGTDKEMSSSTDREFKKLADMKEVWNCCIPEYRLTADSGEELWTVRGETCHCRCCCQLSFKFIGSNGVEAARVTRSCQGCKELIGAANRFTIEFFDSLDTFPKLQILGASFLIDLNYFEKQNKCW